MFLTNASIIHSLNKCNKFLTNYSNNYNLLNASRLFSAIIINFPRQERSAYQCPRKQWELMGSFTLSTSSVSHGSRIMNRKRELYKRDPETSVPFSCSSATVSLIYFIVCTITLFKIFYLKFWNLKFYHFYCVIFCRINKLDCVYDKFLKICVKFFVLKNQRCVEFQKCTYYIS